MKRRSTKALPTPDVLRTLLEYNPETGALKWLERTAEICPTAPTWNARCAGRPAFATPDSLGYREGRVFGIRFRAHQVIWAWMTGAWSPEDIDHINGDPSDNRWANLREVPHAINTRNCKRQSNNTSGHNGVGLRRGKWRALIKIDGKEKYLGSFDNIEDAVAVRKAAEIRHGFHENHGRAR